MRPRSAWMDWSNVFGGWMWPSDPNWRWAMIWLRWSHRGRVDGDDDGSAGHRSPEALMGQPARRNIIKFAWDLHSEVGHATLPYWNERRLTSDVHNAPTPQSSIEDSSIQRRPRRLPTSTPWRLFFFLFFFLFFPCFSLSLSFYFAFDVYISLFVWLEGGLNERAITKLIGCWIRAVDSLQCPITQSGESVINAVLTHQISNIDRESVKRDRAQLGAERENSIRVERSESLNRHQTSQCGGATQSTFWLKPDALP